jgi:hypothetical protein
MHGKDDMIELDIDNKKSDEQTCLLEFFYHKINKYFGEIVFILEASIEKTKNLNNNTNTISSSNSNPNLANQESVEINTTISNFDQTEESNIQYYKIINNKMCGITEQQGGIYFNPQSNMPHSKSQNDLQLEFLQSQADPNSTTANNPNKNDTLLSTHNSVNNFFANQNSDINPLQPKISTGTASLLTCLSLNNDVEIFNLNIIKTLQNKFMIKFCYFLSNQQLNQSIEDRFFSMKNCTHLISNNLKCSSCHKEMLNSLLILIDYQLNEKFIYDFGHVDFVDYFEKYSTSNVEFLLPKRGATDEDIQKEASILYKNEPPSSTNIYLRLINCFNILLPYLNQQFCFQNMFDSASLSYSLNSNKVKITRFRNELLDQKLKMNESFLKNDYRIKNLFCIFKLADLKFSEEFSESDSDEHSDTSDDDEQNTVMDLEENRKKKQKLEKFANTNKMNHLKTNLISLNSFFRSFVEEYFDYEA